MRISLDGGRLDIWEALCYYVSPSGNWKVTKSQVKCEKTYFSTFQYRVHLRLTKWWKHLAYYIVPVTFLSFFFNIPLFINLKVKHDNSFDTKLKSKMFCMYTEILDGRCDVSQNQFVLEDVASYDYHWYCSSFDSFGSQCENHSGNHAVASKFWQSFVVYVCLVYWQNTYFF